MNSQWKKIASTEYRTPNYEGTMDRSNFGVNEYPEFFVADIFRFSKDSGNDTDGFSFGGWSLLAASPVVRETPAMEQGNERETPASERRTACEAWNADALMQEFAVLMQW